jgi:hypothetical protein
VAELPPSQQLSPSSSAAITTAITQLQLLFNKLQVSAVQNKWLDNVDLRENG